MQKALSEAVYGADSQAEATLRGRELQFRSLLETLPAGAYTCDREGLITYFNQQAAELWGRTPQLNHPVDRFCGSFKLFSLEGAPIMHSQCWMAQALRTGTEYNGGEIVIERPSGEKITVQGFANPIRDESGSMLGALNVLVDITDRKRGEDTLRQVERTRVEFLATLAHELRNPLELHNAAKYTEQGGHMWLTAERQDSQVSVSVQEGPGARVPTPAALRILVVDDNLDAAETMSMWLEMLGNEIRTCHDGLEAVRIASEFQADVALLDIGMPKLNGYDAALRIRQQPGGEKMILIATTGWGQERDIRRAMASGFDHHFVKPVDPKALMQLLGTLRPLAPDAGPAEHRAPKS